MHAFLNTDPKLIAAVAGLVAGLVVAWLALFKPLIEVWSPAKLANGQSNPVHDSILRFATVLLAGGFIVLDVEFPAIFALVAASTGVAVGAMGGFHLATSNGLFNTATTDSFVGQAATLASPAPFISAFSVPAQSDAVTLTSAAAAPSPAPAETPVASTS